MLDQSMWPTISLGDLITDMQPGFARRPNVEKVGIPQLRTNNVSNSGTIDLSNVKYVSASRSDQEKYSVRRGDVIFNNTNSPELVGRAAFFDLDDHFVISNHMTRLRTKAELLDPQFLAKYLHYLWQKGASLRWAKQWVNQAAIDQIGLLQFLIPLPPLPEQQRIVAILRKADELRQLRRRAKQRARDLLPALFYTMFGDINPKRTLPEGWTISPIAAYFSDTQYGLSSSLIDEANGNVGVLRMNNISIDGELDLSDLRYLASEDVDFERYDLKAGDILFNRTNSKELVGKTGLWQPLGDQKYTFASYLIRVRLKQGLLPEYLWAALNSPYGKAQMRRLSKQAVNMANINTDELGSIILVIPPKQVQEKFRNLYVRLATHQIIQKNAEQPLDNLLHSLLARAFTGKLTAAWREAHAKELRAAADERDRLLELARKPTDEPVGIELDTAALAKTLASFQAVTRELTSKTTQPALPGFPKLANGLTQTALPAFTRMAEVLRPFIELELGAEKVNRQLRENFSTFTTHILDQLLQALEPLVEHYRAEQQTYFAELAKKLADLARLQLEIPFRREEVEERVFEVAGGHDGYVTLPALAGDWRLNQFSRQSIQEAVNMLAVRGWLRPTVLKLETGDPERPYTLLSAYAPVRETDLVSVEEIEL